MAKAEEEAKQEKIKGNIETLSYVHRSLEMNDQIKTNTRNLPLPTVGVEGKVRKGGRGGGGRHSTFPSPGQAICGK
jgi:hypothetical protein